MKGTTVEPEAQTAAVVTGGAGGIGSALSLRLAQDGFFVYVCCNGNQKAGEAVVTEIRLRGGAGEVLAFDIKDAAATEKSLGIVAQGPRKIGAVVHAAGIVKRALFAQTSPDSWESVVGANLNGFFHSVQRDICQ